MSIVDVPAAAVGQLGGAWRQCVGTGRMALSLRQDAQESLAVLQQEIGFRWIRGHGLFHDDMAVHRPYTHQGRREVHHSFTYVDQVVDAYLRLGLAPVLELGFMPSGLASGEQTVFWWQGNVTPPSSYREWEQLVRSTLRHLVDRYGLEVVRGWPVEVWNEPDLDVFWQGADQQEYFRLYEVTAHAVKSVDASLQVGGPALSPGGHDWWEPFAQVVQDRDLPCDFVSSHAYSSGPPDLVPFGSHQALMPAAALLDHFAAPRRHLAGTALAGLPVHVTEFNSSYRPDNPVHDTALNAAYLAPVLAGGGDLVDSFSYWTASDVFEESGVPVAPFHGGFGLLGHRQLRKPTFHLYAAMARMGEEVLARGEDHLVTRHPDGRLAVLAWQPVDGGPDPAPERHGVRLSLPLDAPAAFVRRTRVGEVDGNALTAWREMGRPSHPTSWQLDVLHEASRPAVEHRRHAVSDGRVVLDLPLTRHEVTWLEVVPLRDETPPWTDDSRVPGYGTGTGDA